MDLRLLRRRARHHGPGGRAADGTFTRRAALVSGGVAAEAQIGDVRVKWTDDGFCRALSCAIKSAQGDMTLTGTARQAEQFVPLRHHKPEEGASAVTRIGYSAYEFSLDGRHGLGIIEVLDRLVDGRPISMTSQSSAARSVRRVSRGAGPASGR